MRKSYTSPSSRWHHRFLLLAAAFVLLFTGSAFAQSVTISGKVSDELGNGLTGVAITIKQAAGTTASNRGAVTDSDGKYTIDLDSPNDVLVFTYLGYKTEERSASGRTTLNLTMKEDATSVEEVVVVGYGVQKKEFLVGSVSQVSGRELTKAPMNNVSNMMTGKLPGVTSIQRSGTPGSDGSSILVRGVSTFNGSAPLCLVDGVERMINTVNPNDIASISILKDAATASIYGMRAANGVILITTKSGSEGPATIAYDGSVTFTQNTAVPEMLNGPDYVYWHNKAREMDGAKPYYTPEVLRDLDNRGILGNTDWLSKIYKSYGLTHQHNISATGGSKNIKYYASIGMLNQDGILRNTDYQRYNVRSNIDAKIAKNLNFSMNISAFLEEKSLPGYNIASQSEFNPISMAFYAIPILKDTYEGKPVSYNNGTYEISPYAALTQSGYQKTQRWQFEGSAKLEYDLGGSFKPLEGLKVSVFAAYNYGFTGNKNYLSSYDLMSFSPQTMQMTPSKAQGVGENNFTKSASHGGSLHLRPQISYQRTFGRHAVSGLFLYEQSKSNSDTMTGYRKGYIQKYPIDLSMGMTPVAPYATGSFGHTGVASYAGRFTYAFDKRYLAEFTFRADGSYKFAPKNRWGFFPSAAIGWVLSEEKFFKQAFPNVDLLKFRASYGEMGSDDTDPFLYIQSYKSTAPGYAYVIGGQAQSVFYSGPYRYDNLTWSRAKTFNVGMDLSLWNGKFGMEFDFFYKVTDKILEKQGGAYAPSLGGNVPVFGNTGKVDNRGFELILKHNNWFSSGWHYSLVGNLSWARNRILKMKISDSHPSYRAILGQPIGAIYGFIATGLFQTQEQLDAAPTAPSGDKKLGDLMYRDINGDGRINQTDDYVKIGRSSIPEMNFSLNMEVGWKGLQLSALWQGVALVSYQLNGVYANGHTDATTFTRPFYSNGNAPYYIVNESWTPEHTDAKYPRLSAAGNGNNNWSSSWWTKDGSYLRLKNLQLSYSLPKKLISKLGLSRASIYFAGTNLWTISSFKYVDPEMPSINNGYYPQQRTFSIGANLTF